MKTRTTYRLSQITSNGNTLYVCGFIEYADGSVGYHWSANLSAASKFGRARALAAAEQIEKEQGAYYLTRSESFRADFPKGYGEVVVRPVTGGEPVVRAVAA